MFLIVGLGNYPKEYELNRHNIGFMSVDNFAQKYSADFKTETKFCRSIATGRCFAINPICIFANRSPCNVLHPFVSEMVNKHPGQFSDLIQAGAGIDGQNRKMKAEGSKESAGKRYAPHTHEKAVNVEKRVAARGKHAVDNDGANAPSHHVHCENYQHPAQTIPCRSCQLYG